MVCCLLVCHVASAAVLTSQVANPAVVIPARAEGIDLSHALMYWHEPEGHSGFDDALQRYRDGAFKPLTGVYPNVGFRDGNNWFVFALRNGLSEERALLLEVDYAILDELEFYCLGDREPPRYIPAGDHIQYASRFLKVRNFVFPVELQADETRHCLVRVQSSSNIMLPVQVFDTLAYMEATQSRERIVGVLYGIALALLIYNLVQYFSSRQSVYFFFTLHVLGGMLYMTFMDGTLSNLWIALDMQDAGAIIAISLAAAGALLFASEFLELEHTHIWLFRVGNLLFFISIAFIFATLIAPLRWMHISISLYILLACFYLAWVGLVRVRDGFDLARIYLAGFGLVFLVISWIVVNLFILQADLRWITYGVSGVWIAELVVLSVALGTRVKVMERAHTQLNQRMQNLHDQSQSRTEFMAKVSHEIRTPMNGVLGLTELMLGTPMDKDQKRYVKAIQNAGRGLLDVIGDILDFSRIEAGKMKFTLNPFDLQALLHDACAIYEFEARAKCIELGCFIAPGTPLNLVGDETRIRQIILNTLSNAFKYTNSGYVHINVQLSDQIHNDKLVLHFEVEDTGIGISAEDQNKLFQSWSQLDQGWQSSRGGVGLGLVISQQIAELMGGEMGVQSELGKGSCFWFNVPVGLPENVQTAESAIVLDLFDGSSRFAEQTASLDSAETGSGEPIELAVPESGVFDSVQPEAARKETVPRILVVEDNEINQNVIVGFMSKMGLPVALADNGRVALERVKTDDVRFDLILMDCEMPVMDGYEAASRILKWQQGKHVKPVPIIALSAHAMDKHRQMALDAGMVDYIAKPIVFRDLKAKVEKYLSLKSDPG